MQKTVIIVFSLILLSAAATAVGARDDLIEVRMHDKTYRGRALAHDNRYCWLVTQDGRLHRLRMDGVRGFRSLSPRFRGLKAVELRALLKKEFGKEFEVAGTTHYLCVAPKGRAKKYVQVFEDVYRAFSSYFSARGFRIDPPRYPLVAVIFPDQQSFALYARREKIDVSLGTLGYYHRLSNRVTLFDAAGGFRSKRKTSSLPTKAGWAEIHARIGRPRGVRQSLIDTIIHETVHQVAFNTGLHSRVGQTPHWIVEGLATLFEAPGIRNRSGSRGSSSRINRGRFIHFRNMIQRRRKANSLKSFIASDDKFRSSTTDAYAEAWALTFFLNETQSSKYTQYLRIVAKRDPLKPYTAEMRVADFQTAFGKDLKRLDSQFIRFMKRLK